MEEFNGRCPGVSVKLELTPYDQYFIKLDAAVSGDGLPDVFCKMVRILRSTLRMT